MNRAKLLMYVLVGVLTFVLIGRSNEKAVAEDCIDGGPSNCGCGCWWNLDEGTVGGPGNWECEPQPMVDWCEIDGGTCTEGTGGCVLL